MDEGKILLVRLPVASIGADAVTLLGSILISQLLNAALSRDDIPEAQRRFFALYADEYHRFAISDFASLLAEARKFGVATTVAHQYLAQLDTINRAAVKSTVNKVVFQVNPDDGRELSGGFFHEPEKGEITGHRPIQVPSTRPLQDLLDKSLSSADIRELVTKELVPLSQAANQAAHAPGHVVAAVIAKAQFVARQTSLLKGISAINDHFTKMMLQQIEPHTPQEATSLYEILLSLAGYLTLMTEYMIVEDLPTYNKPNEESIGLDQRRHLTQEERRMLYEEQLERCKATSHFTLERPTVIAFGNELLDFLIQICSFNQHNQAHEVDWSPITQRLRCGQEGVNYGSYTCTFDANKAHVIWSKWRDLAGSINGDDMCEFHYLPRAYQFDPEAMPSALVKKFAFMEPHVQQYAMIRTTRIRNFIEAIMTIGRYLVDNPIMTNSSDMEPIYDRPRAYSDVQAEVASKLAHLPNRQAKVRLVQDNEVREYHLATLPPPPAGEVLQLSNESYTRPRAEVEAEIAKRQEPPETPLRRRVE